jgi:hypothetical protein
LKVPSGYSSNFKRLVSVKDMKMNFNLMKSHDCHVLMTTLLPVALRGIKTKQVHDTITMLTVYFGTPNMFVTLRFGFDYGNYPPLGTLII